MVLPSTPSSVICSANATFPPVGGRQRAAEGGGPYERRRGQSPPYMVRVTRRGAHCTPAGGQEAAAHGETGAISPPVSLRSTAPSSEGAKKKSLPLTREVAFAKQMTEGEIGRCGRARRFVAPHAQRASPGGRQGRTHRCAPTWWRAGRPLIRPSGPPSPRGEGAGGAVNGGAKRRSF